jgi:hypothetical protein
MRAWKPITAGIMSIIAGIIGIGGGIIVSLFTGEFVAGSGGIFGFEPFGVPTIILGVVAFVGGIFSVRRRVWPLAIAGAICAIPCMPVLGTLAIVFVSLADEEFIPLARGAAQGKSP